MRVLHGPSNVGNQAYVLSRAERALGIDSELVVAEGNWLAYASDRVLRRPGEPGGVGKLRQVAFGAAAPLRYDVIHLYFARSYIHRGGHLHQAGSFLDLKLARALGRRVVMTLQGCDVRRAGLFHARDPNGMCADGACRLYEDCIARYDAGRSRFVQSILPLVDRVFYLNPDLGHDLPPEAEFLPYANVDIAAITPVTPSGRERPLVLHAPTDRGIKGSDAIEAALQGLSTRFDFDYRALSGVPHAEAMALYRQADLVIDQVRAGWYGGLAVEVMALGKPVVAYIRDGDLVNIPPQMARELPILRVTEATLEADLGRILERRAAWDEIGRASRRFVERWHDPARIAASLVEIYRDPKRPLDVA